MIYEANNLEVNYEVVKPEERTPQEMAEHLAVFFYSRVKDLMSTRSAIEIAKLHVEKTIRLPLIGSGRMQPENLSDLKYWKDVLSELEKM